MATQNPLLAPGTWVQLTNTSLNPPPIGIIRSAFHHGGGPYYQVVWFPGSRFPRSSLYESAELKTMTSQQAAQAIQSYNISQGNVATTPYLVGITRFPQNWTGRRLIGGNP